MSLYLLAEVANNVEVANNFENNDTKILCNGWWNKKTKHFIPVTKTWHSPLYSFCYILILLKYKTFQSQ